MSQRALSASYKMYMLSGQATIVLPSLAMNESLALMGSQPLQAIMAVHDRHRGATWQGCTSLIKY